MADKPILFSGPMVRALIDGSKTQTRRVLKPQFPDWVDSAGFSMFTPPDHISGRGRYEDQGPAEKYVKLPINQGDRLWVKEAHGYTGSGWTNQDPEIVRQHVTYRADGVKADVIVPRLEEKDLAPRQNVPKDLHVPVLTGDPEYDEAMARSDWLNVWWKRQKTRPSIFMYRHWSRLTLTVTNVRVQRLQNISDDDAKAEGVEQLIIGTARNPINMGYRSAYTQLWDHLNEPRGFGWDINPWVVAYTFTVEKKNIDQ